MPLIHLLRSNTFSGERILPVMYQKELEETVFLLVLFPLRLAVGISVDKKNRSRIKLTFHLTQLNAQVEWSLLT